MFMNKRIYLDYAAGTPVDKRVLAAMKPYFNRQFGNPGSIHREGQAASAAVFNSRLKISRALDCDYKEIIFTGTASEANNLALRGIFKNLKLQDLKPKIIISAIEHESIAETARDLEKDGVEVVVIPISKEGIIDLKRLKAALDERTVLVSVMYANNEIGTVQPIREIGEIINEYKQGKIASVASLPRNDGRGLSKSYKPEARNYPLFHTDAVQAFQYLPCKPEELGVDLMTLSAHKIYGPKGIGLLYIKDFSRRSSGNKLEAIITGGEQEGAARAGTENVPYIAGFAKAVELAEVLREKEARRIEKLRDYFWAKIKKIEKNKKIKKYINVELNGSLQNRLPNNLNIYLPNHKAQDLLIALDLKGVAASAGAACSMRTTEPSKVITALGYSKERALASLRFSLGRETTKQEIDAAAHVLALSLTEC
jgi:cysteine desulfurase